MAPYVILILTFDVNILFNSPVNYGFLPKLQGGGGWL
jgi:hypothetical protein